ncbi:MAG TPA: hypothetical protein VHG91_16345 [Longimicrobium sp.]|nr:hypothetical protein [Longimicrobium sp.]
MDDDAGMDEARVRALVAELDAAVPREGAAVRFELHGGLDETAVVANPRGALRLGVELLRASLRGMDEAAAGRTPFGALEVEYALDDASDFVVDGVVVRDPLPEPRAPRKERGGRFIGALLAVLAGAIVLVLALAWAMSRLPRP